MSRLTVATTFCSVGTMPDACTTGPARRGAAGSAEGPGASGGGAVAMVGSRGARRRAGPRGARGVPPAERRGCWRADRGRRPGGARAGAGAGSGVAEQASHPLLPCARPPSALSRASPSARRARPPRPAAAPRPGPGSPPWRRPRPRSSSGSRATPRPRPCSTVRDKRVGEREGGKRVWPTPPLPLPYRPFLSPRPARRRRESGPPHPGLHRFRGQAGVAPAGQPRGFRPCRERPLDRGLDRRLGRHRRLARR